MSDDVMIFMVALLFSAALLGGLAFFVFPNIGEDENPVPDGATCNVGVTEVDFTGVGYYQVDGLPVNIVMGHERIQVGSNAHIYIWDLDSAPITQDMRTGYVEPEPDEIFRANCNEMLYIEFMDYEGKPQDVVEKGSNVKEEPQDIVVGDIYDMDFISDLGFNNSI